MVSSEHMHTIQQKLLKLSKERNLGKLTLREMGELIGEKSPQKMKHHLQQLEKKGFIRVDKIKGVIEKKEPGWAKGLLNKTARLLSIPIVGSASAGPAEIFAEKNIEGYLRISNTLLSRKTGRDLFALKVQGPSMNRVEIGERKIEDGDYVIVDASDQNPQDGNVVLSIIDGMANIKKFYLDKANHQIVLMSDSTYEFPPIHIHEDDDYKVNGKVVQVVKKPKVR